MNRSNYLFALLAAGMIPGTPMPKARTSEGPRNRARECARRVRQREAREAKAAARLIDAGGVR